ncbi:MAG: hypothetical protein R3194_11380 [Limnobacter sp.]|nr:hypothetical protein [Limnobacter sp.]
MAEQAIALRKLLTGWPAMRGVTFEPGPIKNGTLVLFVANPSALSRIKQSIPSLLDMLRSKGWLIQKVKVKIQTLQPQSLTAASRQKKALMPDIALKEWEKLEKNLQDPVLRAAIARLNHHHRES